MLKVFNSKRKKGFTLIELLVVIAILGILVLLAAPRFLGYTKDANVATMQADVKVLSNAALVYNIENDGAWPVTGTDKVGTISSADFGPADLYEIDKEVIASQVQNLKGDESDYGIVVDGGNAGAVYHLTGIEDRDGDIHYGVDLVDYYDVEDDTVTVTTPTP